MSYYDRIRLLCKHCNVSLEELAEGVGTTVNRFQHWGRKHFTPDWDLLIKIAEYLQISLRYLAIDADDELFLPENLP